MDRQSHYTWTLTNDELITVWYALTDRADYMRKMAKKDPSHADVYEPLAKESEALYRQINRMRRMY